MTETAEASSERFVCSYCPDYYVAISESILLSHIRLVHSSEPGFSIQCSANGCSRTFTNFRTYQNHRLTHRTSPDAHLAGTALPDRIVDHSMISEPEYVSTVGSSEENSSINIPSFVARWLLKTTETRSLTRAASVGIVEDVSHLMDFVIQQLHSQTCDVLTSNGVETTTIAQIKEIFSSDYTKPFEGLTTFYQQLQYYQRHFNFVVCYYKLIFCNYIIMFVGYYTFIHC